MTPTPRTDAAEILWNDTGLCVVPAEFARYLERENQTFRAAQKACEDCDAPRVDRIAELERELADKSESLAFQTQLNREVIEREKQTFADLATEREQVAILRSDEKRLVAFAKTYRMNAEILSDKLASERALADRLAEMLANVQGDYASTGVITTPEVDTALTAWKEARRGTA